MIDRDDGRAALGQEGRLAPRRRAEVGNPLVGARVDEFGHPLGGPVLDVAVVPLGDPGRQVHGLQRGVGVGRTEGVVEARDQPIGIGEPGGLVRPGGRALRQALGQTAQHGVDQLAGGTGDGLDGGEDRGVGGDAAAWRAGRHPPAGAARVGTSTGRRRNPSTRWSRALRWRVAP